ncbi:protein translocase subunit SecF [Candidatus Albibeggiatoa sp. nov. NOAA]|uniref:protein translocase subunit SecF n=1 Tax=Candidatus Albibeggiatoa sp. nov. NOAA TaxID=3162724 RepID=UPI0032F0E66A|nr:protein translocase subunit SecF [Thiotrichaceae bacterium]
MNILNRFDYNYDFLGKRKVATIVSTILMLIALASLGLKGLSFGIDFTGGTLVEVRYSVPVELDEVRELLHSNGFEDAVVQNFGTTKDVLIRLGIYENMKNEEISSTILGLLKQQDSEVVMKRVEFVGPKVGGELVEKGGMAILLTLFGILIYVTLRFEYRFALGSIAALVHDTVITVGFFSLLGLEFDLTVLAAVLAVIGYSLNDTIVVFDRIRDNFLKMRKQNSEQVVNRSINQILGRTVMTSVTTLLVLLVLFFAGGELIHNFAIALIVGVIVGTYSSIYIASATALHLGISKADLMPVQKEGAQQQVDERP